MMMLMTMMIMIIMLFIELCANFIKLYITVVNIVCITFYFPHALV